jgi:hypothetical protein
MRERLLVAWNQHLTGKITQEPTNQPCKSDHFGLYSFHGRYGLLSLLYARCSRGIGSLGLSPETSNHGFPIARDTAKADVGILFLQPILIRSTNQQT